MTLSLNTCGALLGAGFLFVPIGASAQLALSFTNAPSDTRTVAPGGLTTFNALLTNQSTTSSLELIGIGVTLTSLDTTWNDMGNPIFFQNFFTPNEFLAASTSRSGGLFQVALSSNPSQAVPHTYSGTVEVTYLQNGNQGSVVKSFNVQSTPSPPVVLVTLVGGIGAARMALRRRKTGS
jgi:hypothetical protein